MGKSQLEAAQERLQKLTEQKKALEAKIAQEQARFREQERKARTRRLIEYGGLVEIAALTELDKGTVLGLLLEGAQRLQDDASLGKQWKKAGDGQLTQRAAERREMNDRKRGKSMIAVESNGVAEAVS